MNNIIHSPFKFLDAYTLSDRSEFFGRDKEIEQLYQLVFKTPLLLVYGASGTGKTSLIQCGLASRFDGTDWLPLWIRKEDNINQTLEKAIHKVLPDSVEKNKSISENIIQLYQHYLRPVFLIFDQFEELFVFGKEKERAQFIQQITTILDEELPCSIIMVIREEYLGHLYPFEKEIPELFDFRMRVEPMDTARVKTVLTSSFAQFNITVEPPQKESLEQIIENVSQGKSGIELPYLQVYLDRLYREDFTQTYPSESLSKDSVGNWRPIKFTKKELTEFGTIDTVLDKFLDEQVQKIQAKLSLKDSGVKLDAVRLLLDTFVSAEGTKRPIRYERNKELIHLVSTSESVLNLSPSNLSFCLDALEEARLIRSDAQTLELAHDSLAAIINKRRTNEQRQLNDIKRQIRSMHQNFPKTGEYLTTKQITVFEDFLLPLDLNIELKHFYQESQNFRTKEARKELEKVRQQAEQERKLKEQAEAQRQVAQTNEKRAKIRTWIAGLLGLITLGVAIIAISLFQRTQKILSQNQNLQNRVLRSNQLTEIPEEIIQNENFTSLNLRGSRLQKIPKKIEQLQNLSELYLNNNQLRELPKEFGQLQSLSELYLNNNQLRELPKEIGQLQNLSELYLNNNQLRELPKEIGQLQNLSELNLNNNQLSELSKEFGQLQNLSTLNLNNNKLNKLPKKVEQLIKLAYLDLNNNQLRELPKEIGQLQNLSSLDLNNNQLNKLPKEIGQLQNLSSLYLNNNQLRELPKEIGQLQTLSSLNLSGNPLSQLPKEIGQLQTLSSLDFSRNPLSQLPKEIGLLQNLSRLTLKHNQLNKLPKEVEQLTKLTYLNLKFNQLSELPKEIAQLKNLKKLDLRFNQLSELPKEIAQLNNLDLLYLKSNELSELPKEFGQLNSLAGLSLSFNQLNELPKEFGQLNNLISLGLSFNQLNELPKEFGQLNNLYYLDLSDNQLSELPKEFGQLNSLRSLDLSSNQLNKLPKEIGQLKNLHSLELSSNQLNELPKEFGQLSELVFLHISGNHVLISKIDSLKQLLPKCKIITNYEDSAQQQFQRYNYQKAYNYLLLAIQTDSTDFNTWFNLSFYALFVSEPQTAINAAITAKTLKPDALSVDTNLALGYLFNNQWTEAKAIYLLWKGKSFPNDDRLCDNIFLQDITDLEVAEITHPDFEKVKVLFKK